MKEYKRETESKNYVKVVNPIVNAGQFMKRKKADFYVAQGRAEWVGVAQLKITDTHPKNIAARKQSSSYLGANYSPQSVKAFQGGLCSPR